MALKRTARPVKTPVGVAACKTGADIAETRTKTETKAKTKTNTKIKTKSSTRTATKDVKATTKAATVKTTAARTTATAVKAAATTARIKAPAEPAATGLTAGATARAIAARMATIARTQHLVDAAPLEVDARDDVAKAKVAALREAKTRASDHQGRARRSAVERANDPPAATGAALIERVSRAIERELTQIEVIVGGHYVPPRQRTEAERRARTLASLARTLREITALRLSGKKEKREDDDAVPRDLSELRLALARRLDRLVADAKAAHPERSD